jgi:hypothetical protein
MKFYKPNPKNTGSCGSFSVTSSGKQQGFYVELLKQKSWDDKAKTGTFDSSKENKLNLKFNPTEIAGMMQICQRQKGVVKFFHNTGEVTSSISFGVYPDKEGETPRGIALSVSKGDKRGSLPLTFQESTLLLEWFRWALGRVFTADYTEAKKMFEERSNGNL